MQPLTFVILFTFFVHAAQLKTVALNDFYSPRSLEFNVNIKNYPGTTTTTEESLLSQISGSVSDTISNVYNKVKNAVTGGSEEKDEKVKFLYPAHYLSYSSIYPRPYPLPYPLPVPGLVNPRLPIPVLNKPVNQHLPSDTVNNKNSNIELAGGDGNKTNQTEVHYFVNKFGRVIAKEFPKSNYKQEQSKEKPSGNYFSIDLHGVVQNSSSLSKLPSAVFGDSRVSSGNQKLKVDLKNLVNDIIAVQNMQAKR